MYEKYFRCRLGVITEIVYQLKESDMSAVPSNFRRTTESSFLRLVEDIGRALEPTPTQLATLETSYNSTGEFLVNCPEFKGHLEQVVPHGSRAIGTMTRPLRGGEGFDIDLMARLNRLSWSVYGGENGPSLLLNHLHTAVTRYASQHNLKLVKWERCVTLEYADGMCADIAPVIDAPHTTALHGDTHGRIPDHELRSFHATNPLGLTRQFNTIAAIQPVFLSMEALDSVEAMHKAEVVPLPDVDVFGRLICRLVQMVKLHRNIAFSQDGMSGFSPSSLFITTLITGAYQRRAPVPHLNQLDLLLDVIRTMPTLITIKAIGNDNYEWALMNPTAPEENLASSMNQPGKQQAFRQWHDKLVADVEKLLQTIESRPGLDQVTSLVESTFGEKASMAMREGGRARQAQIRQAGAAASVTSAGLIIPISARSNSFFGE
jgi:hypothetical protein